jgi:gluconolactonase
VHCFDPDGTLIGKLLLPNVVSNLTFGGPKGNRLFITATTSVWSWLSTAQGAQLGFTDRLS